jgi:hypothetical protein
MTAKIPAGDCKAHCMLVESGFLKRVTSLKEVYVAIDT